MPHIKNNTVQHIALCDKYAEDCRQATSDESLGANERLGAQMGELDWLMARENSKAETLKQYREFLGSKEIRQADAGITVDPDSLNPSLMDFQGAVVQWALRKGQAAIFAGCGLGKTFMQLEWGHRIHEATGRDVLILAPLAVAEQTESEAAKFGIGAKVCVSQSDVSRGISITNYEKLDRFDAKHFGAIILDESSILKSFDGAFRKQITDLFADTPYRLACTATPAPNDYMELGTHAEFLGVMTRTEMLATFFVHDGGETSKWRLKGHAEKLFWKWVCSWAVMLQKPSDIGYSDEQFKIPPVQYHQHVIALENTIAGMLFTPDRLTLTERRDVRRDSLPARVAKCADIVMSAPNEQWLTWCDLNAESEALAEALPGAVEVRGSDTQEHKSKAALGFATGEIDTLVSKPSIFGFGMNFQSCSHMIFCGLSDSFEQIYQAVRRCWRFGQTKTVHVHIVTSDGDGPVVENIKRKERDFETMSAGMIEHMREEMQLNVSESSKPDYREGVRKGDDWAAYRGDCVEKLLELPSESIDFSVFSPPFASLYTYSASDRDMGNSKTYAQFTEHFGFLSEQLFRVIKSGRLVSIHCMNLPTSKERDGYIGIRDFRGDIIRAMQEHGFIYHSEVCIWKDPVTAMQRTKAIGLLYKQLRKDSTISRQGIPDYLVTFRKPGENVDRVTKTHESFPVALWQRFASPVWMDINPSDTLQKESAREHEDERHIAPLQLQVIERAIQLWTNKGDTVLSPFMGIGSEGYVSIRNERKFIGIELKESYWRQAIANLSAAETSGKAQPSLFSAESD